MTVASGEHGADDSSDEGEWITPDNVGQFISHGDTQALNLIKEDPHPETDTPALGDASNVESIPQE